MNNRDRGSGRSVVPKFQRLSQHIYEHNSNTNLERRIEDSDGGIRMELLDAPGFADAANAKTNRLADIEENDDLVRTLFGLITGPCALAMCKQLVLRYQQLFAFTFSVLMFLLIPCIYLRTILQHPLPSSISPQTTNESAYLDALFNTSDIFTNSSNDGGNGTTTPLPFSPFGRLSQFPLLALAHIVFLCFCRAFASLRLPECRWVDASVSCSRICIAIIVVYCLSLFAALVCICRLVDLHTTELFNSFSYWEAKKRVAAWLQFAVCSFACAAYWAAMLLAATACFKLDTNRHIGSWKCFKVLMIAFFVCYVAMWLILIALDYYFNFMYR